MSDDHYFVQLNQSPQADLPVDHLPKKVRPWAKKRFRMMSEQMIKKIDSYSLSFPSCRDRQVNLCDFSHEKCSTNWQGWMLYWNRPCYRSDSSSSGINDLNFEFSHGHVIEHAFQCPPNDDSHYTEFWKTTRFPTLIKGVLLLDWNGDGKEDIALWMENGQFIFLQREACSDLKRLRS